MARGGVRAGSGRPKGAPSLARRNVLRLIERMSKEGPVDMLAALAAVIEDTDAPLPTRFEATFLLSGAMAGRLCSTTQKQINSAAGGKSDVLA